jgi:hypothetical protein
MIEYHWGEKNHSKQVAPHINRFIVKLEQWSKYRFNWACIPYPVTSLYEFIVHKMQGCLGNASNEAIEKLFSLIYDFTHYNCCCLDCNFPLPPTLLLFVFLFFRVLQIRIVNGLCIVFYLVSEDLFRTFIYSLRCCNHVISLSVIN